MKRRKERVLLTVAKGALVPADAWSARRLRERGYNIGDSVLAELTKPRNPGFHRLAHQFGVMCVENIEAFEGMDSHAVLKRLQIEANVGCDEIALQFPGVGPCTYRVPRSLSYETMDQGEFSEAIRGMCRHVAKTYWRGLSAEQIERMAGVMVSEAA